MSSRRKQEPEGSNWSGFGAEMRIIEASGIEVKRGDLVCFDSGLGDLVMSLSGMLTEVDAHPARRSELDGRDRRLLQWIEAPGSTALISDGVGIEAFLIRPQDGETLASWSLQQLCPRSGLLFRSFSQAEAT